MICPTLLLSRPSRPVRWSKRPSRRQLSPPPAVPIQSTSSASYTSARMASLDRPFFCVKCSSAPSLYRHRPLSYVPAHRAPSRSKARATTPSANVGPPPNIGINRLPSTRTTPLAVASQKRPALSSATSNTAVRPSASVGARVVSLPASMRVSPPRVPTSTAPSRLLRMQNTAVLGSPSASPTCLRDEPCTASRPAS